MKGFLIFISIVCGFYILCPDPIPFVVDDIVILIICIFCIIGASRSSSSDNSNSDDDDDEEDNDKPYENNTTAIYNYYAPGRTISLDCSHCGASLDLDPDNLIARCPYCHHKILIDTNHLSQLLSEKERTKREQEKTERENLKYQYELEKQRMEIAAKEREEEAQRKKDRRDAKWFIAIFIFLLLMALIVENL